MMLLFWLIYSLAAAHASQSHKGKDCGGSKAAVHFSDLSMTPNMIRYPGKLSVSLSMNVTKTLPDDVVVGLKLYRGANEVPCFLGYLGSCEFNVCEYVKEFKERYCPFFPKKSKCECPLKPGFYHHKSKKLEIKMPDFGSSVASMIVGNYHGKVTLYSEAKPKTILGCVQLPIFTIHT